MYFSGADLRGGKPASPPPIVGAAVDFDYVIWLSHVCEQLAASLKTGPARPVHIKISLNTTAVDIDLFLSASLYFSKRGAY